MALEIDWQVLSARTWDLKVEAGVPVTLLQSRNYAAAYCPLNHQLCQFARLSWAGQPAGQALVFEARTLGGALHTVILDRGPVWFDGFGSDAHIEAFFNALAKRYPRRLGRMRRILPELPDTAVNRALLQGLGFRRKPGPGYKTLILDLTRDLDQLRAAMRKGWRATLVKAERQDTEIIWDDTGQPLPPFIGIYQQDRKEKGYAGPSAELLHAFGRSFGVSGALPIGIAKVNGHPAAGILILRHGSAATYQVGWTLQAGRTAQAHHLLLWHAITRLKAAGVTHFDLGGINPTDAPGVTDFKHGLAGKQVSETELVGFYT